MWSATKNKKYGVAIYNFHTDDIPHSLRLDIGDTVQILEECEGWFRGICTKNRSVKGLFPASYVHLKPFRIDNEGIYEVVLPAEEPVVQEADSVLREWGHIWKKLYVGLRTGEGELILWEAIRKTMLDVADWRKQLHTGTLTSDQTGQLKLKITRKIDWGNRKLGLDLVPRSNGDMVDSDTVSIVELYQVHAVSAETSQHSLGLSTLSKKKLKPKVENFHLFFSMRDFSYHIGEDAEIFFSLYGGRHPDQDSLHSSAHQDQFKMTFITERFLVKHPKEGFSSYVERNNSSSTLFTDLGYRDLASELYIVAHVVRVGRMLPNESGKKVSSQNFRRPYGVALFKLSVDELKNYERELEYSGKLFTADEKDIWQLHELVIKKQSNKYSLASNNTSIGLVINVKLLQGELDQVVKENPLLLKDVCMTNKLGFSDVIMPGQIRNDLYVTLSHGEFERGGKSVGKNIEITVVAVDNSGNPIHCISSGTGHKPTCEFSSTIMYHNNAPRLNEVIKIAIPIDKFSKAHLRFEYRHCSTREKNEKKLFGFSFIRLMEDEGGTTLRNGAHTLCVYKCDDRSRLIVPAEYMSCPFLTENAIDCVYSLPFTRSHKETLVVETLLCSTKLTQNVDLLSLLRWKSCPEGIGETLTRLIKVDGTEMVKFLQDVLDALFGMFSNEDGNSTQYSGHVFHALVFIFSLLENKKFKHFKPVMDAYIMGHFAAALVYKGLISCVKHLSDLCPQTDNQGPILSCFESLEYIFKFIVQSRILFAKEMGGQNEDLFRRDIEELMESFVQLLGLSTDHIEITQVTLLEKIQGACDQLYKVLSVCEVVQHLNSLLNATGIDAPSHIVQAKLHAIKNAATNMVFEDEDGRNSFLRTACAHLRHHLMTNQELTLCANLLSDIIILMHKQIAPFTHAKLPIGLHQDVKTIVLNLLDVLVQVVLTLDVPSHSYGILISSLMGIFQLMRESHYMWLWERQLSNASMTAGSINSSLSSAGSHNTGQLRQLLHRTITLLDQLVRTPIFPADWFVMRMVANHTILNAMQEIAQPLITTFLKDVLFDSQLWTKYFNLAVGFLTQPSLQLEHFSHQKRHKVLERYNDMRVLMGFQILSMWHNLDEHRLHFIPGMVGPFLEVTLVPEPDLRRATLPIFFDMMQAEQQARGNFKQVETELIDKLDILVSENKGDDEYRQLFNTILLDRVKSDDPAWRESGTAFIHSVTRLLERLLDYRSVMQGDENSDKRMSCTVNLLNFYKNEINRQEMYTRYIYKLADLHLPSSNFTEAAFTLQLHAAQLSWSKRVLHADHLYHAQTEFQRKETIYYKVIDYFDRGKCWEQGIPLLEELADQYRSHTFNYEKLSKVHKLMAKFYENILSGERYEHEYFRVGFYGLGLPLFVRNKVFVYRGLEYESISAFTQRIQTEFPQAKLVPHNAPPDETTRTSDGQFVQICAVKPLAAPRPEFEGLEIDERILEYYSNNQVKNFVLDRPTHRGVVDKDNEFKNLWIERIIYTTESELPGILKWFEVVEHSVEQICPPQYACETVDKNCQQIRQMVAHYITHPKDNIQPFTMRLQGSIDAAVNGGIAKYQEAFFRHEYLILNPSFTDHVVKLKSLIAEQTQILEMALEMHGRIAPAVNQPLHKRLLEVFEGLRVKVQRMCSTPQSQRSTTSLHSANTPPPTHRRADSDPNVEFRRIGSIINSPLPPLPASCMGKDPSSSTSGISSQRSSQSSSLYSHFHSVSHDDDLYSKPSDDDGTLVRDSRHRLSFIADSRGYSPNLSGDGNYVMVPSPRPCEDHRRMRHSRPTSPKAIQRDLRNCRDSKDVLSSSWSDSQESHESLPPLPPRTGDRNSRSISLGEDEDLPPILPKRVNKKLSQSNFNSENDVAVSNGLEHFDSNSPPPALSPRYQRSSPPPPIPPKTSFSSPITPSSTVSITPTSSISSTLDLHQILNGQNSSENYSVPQPFQKNHQTSN